MEVETIEITIKTKEFEEFCESLDSLLKKAKKIAKKIAKKEPLPLINLVPEN